MWGGREHFITSVVAGRPSPLERSMCWSLADEELWALGSEEDEMPGYEIALSATSDGELGDDGDVEGGGGVGSKSSRERLAILKVEVGFIYFRGVLVLGSVCAFAAVQSLFSVSESPELAGITFKPRSVK